MRRPAILGGEPAFPDPVAFARPATPALERVAARLAPSWDRGVLTNGPLVRELEERVADRLGAAHVVAVASCTSGLMLALRALHLDGPVALPGFTFSASAHAVAWNGLAPVFVECHSDTFQIDAADVVARSSDCAAVLATHVFGAPCDVDALEAGARSAGWALAFDAAHAFGATSNGRPVGGHGDVEVFSMSPTKPVVAGEGGLVATPHDEVAQAVRIGRDYANPGDYDTRFVGLNARLSELHAAVALESLHDLDDNLARRRHLDARYRADLAGLAGIAPQTVPASDRSACKDFTVAVDDAAFGLDRDAVVRALAAEGVDTRRYFDPPVHRQRSYAHLPPRPLPVTEAVCRRVVSLPMSPTLGTGVATRVAAVLHDLHAHAEQVRRVPPG